MRGGVRIALSIAAGLVVPALVATALIDPQLPLLIAIGLLAIGVSVFIGVSIYEALGD